MIFLSNNDFIHLINDINIEVIYILFDLYL
jgi:hypothetical protein